MCFHWFGSSTGAERINFGTHAVIAPILERMDLAGILDRRLPQDPQTEFSAGSILSLLVAARLSNPVALVNVLVYTVNVLLNGLNGSVAAIDR
jgi:hypothetical protein